MRVDCHKVEAAAPYQFIDAQFGNWFMLIVIGSFLYIYKQTATFVNILTDNLSLTIQLSGDADRLCLLSK